MIPSEVHDALGLRRLLRRASPTAKRGPVG